MTSMKMTVIVMALGLSTPVIAQTVFRDTGVVVDVQEVMYREDGQSTQNCTIQQPTVSMGSVTGAVVGGVVGNRFGRGNGRAVMTAVGATGGYIAGQALSEPQVVCFNNTNPGGMSRGYMIQYEYGAARLETFTTHRFKPGDRINVEVAVRINPNQ